ncbi:hypothetical protein [Endothiovibrio diazotrophicus]
MVDSGFPAFRAKTYWVDEDHVLYSGYIGPKPRNAEEFENTPRGVYVWDVRDGSRKILSPVPSYFCFSDGKAFYYRSKSKRGYMARWANGSFPPVDQHVPLSSGRIDIAEFDCLRKERPAEMVGRRWIPLKMGDGYLDGGDKTIDLQDGLRMTMRDEDGRVVSNLSITERVWSPYRSSYYEFSGRYFLNPSAFFKPDVNRWKKQGCADGWWLSRRGELERVCTRIPEWAPHGGNGVYVPTAAGMLLKTSRKGRPGLYLIRKDRYALLTAGYIDGIGVSPSGCRIAFSHMKNLEAGRMGGLGQPTVMMIELCDPGSRNK